MTMSEQGWLLTHSLIESIQKVYDTIDADHKKEFIQNYDNTQHTLSNLLSTQLTM